MWTQSEFNWDEQEENLERVSARIARAIIAFLENHLRGGRARQFHAEDLRQKVILETGISAPASADRVLRDLRQRGVVDYRVISRRESLYEVISVKVSS